MFSSFRRAANQLLPPPPPTSTLVLLWHHKDPIFRIVHFTTEFLWAGKRSCWVTSAHLNLTWLTRNQDDYSGVLPLPPPPAQQHRDHPNNRQLPSSFSSSPVTREFRLTYWRCCHTMALSDRPYWPPGHNRRPVQAAAAAGAECCPRSRTQWPSVEPGRRP